jgi:hypothetical protein
MLPPTAAVRVNVINFTGDPAPFLLRLNSIQVMDTTARAGTLYLPVMVRSFFIAPGLHHIQLLDRRSRQIVEEQLETGKAPEQNHATLELLFYADSVRISKCYCVRVYGSSGG